MIVELSDASNQHISTLNTSGWITLLMETGKSQLVTQIFNHLLEEQYIKRTYLGSPITIDFLKDPNYWIDYELNLQIFKNFEKYGLDPIELGKATVIKNLSNRGSIILSIVNLVGLGPTLNGVQKVNEKYNQSKIAKVSEVTTTSGIVELFYLTGFSHFEYVTMHNIGCYLAVLEYLQYEEVNYHIEVDRYSNDSECGYSKIRFRWKKKSKLNNFVATIKKLFADKFLEGYLRSNSYLHTYHSDLMQNYEYQLSIKEQLLREREIAHLNLVKQYKAIIADQTEELIKTKSELEKSILDSKEMIIDWFNENCENSDLKASDLSTFLSISEAKMNSKLKYMFALTFKKLLINVRIEKACALLTHKTPTEVAYTVGFKSPSHFSEVFRKEKGMTPSQFKESI
tara:strand:+ start:2066 stop:3262 length:1197 start_codon:yes stop_codon:yes gene_type:complete